MGAGSGGEMKAGRALEAMLPLAEFNLDIERTTNLLLPTFSCDKWADAVVVARAKTVQRLRTALTDCSWYNSDSWGQLEAVCDSLSADEQLYPEVQAVVAELAVVRAG